MISNVDMIYYNGFDEMLLLRDKIDFARNEGNDFIIWKGNKIPVD